MWVCLSSSCLPGLHCFPELTELENNDRTVQTLMVHGTDVRSRMFACCLLISKCH